MKVLTNDGSGQYSDETASRFPSPGRFDARAMAIADLDGDGDLDAALSGSLAMNDGHGHFTAAPAPFDGLPISSLESADFDGDGDSDLIVATADISQSRPAFYNNYLLLNDGSGTFSYTTNALGEFLYNRHSSFALAVGDVDEDGDIDALLGNGPGYYARESRSRESCDDRGSLRYRGRRHPPR